jgi:hypothetical protein
MEGECRVNGGRLCQPPVPLLLQTRQQLRVPPVGRIEEILGALRLLQGLK